MKKLISILMAIFTLFTFSIPTLAAPAKRDEFKVIYEDYTTYYDNTYVPSYQQYNKSLDALKNEILAANITTAAQAQRITAFLTGLKTRKFDFFGTRDMAKKSRGLVPSLRIKTQNLYAAKDYNTAIDYCGQLKTAVIARVTFLGDLKTEIDNFDVIEPGSETPDPVTPNVSAAFEITEVNSKSSYAFKITLRNNSDTALTNWALKFDYNGSVNTMWVDGSSVKYKKTGDTFVVTPHNEHQNIYTIPAHSTVVIQGNGKTPGTGISNSTMSGQAFTMTFKGLK